VGGVSVYAAASLVTGLIVVVVLVVVFFRKLDETNLRPVGYLLETENYFDLI